MEAYAKFKDKNPFPLLAADTFFPDAGFVSYWCDRHAILSLAYDSGTIDHAVFWIDPAAFASIMETKPAHLPCTAVT